MIEEKWQKIIHIYLNKIEELELKLEKKCNKKRVVKIIQEQLKEQKKKSTPSWADVVKHANTKENILAFYSVLTELDERKSRERNIVLFGIKEHTLKSREGRQQSHARSVQPQTHL